MNDGWFYEAGGVRHGPVSQDELRRLVHEGKLKPANLCWTAAFGSEWRPVSQVPDLLANATASTAPAGQAVPPAGTRVNNIYANLFASVPLIGAVIELAANRWTGHELGGGPRGLIGAYIGAYVGLFLADRQMAANAGTTALASKRLWWSILLAPCYLFIRDRRLGNRQYRLFGWLAGMAVLVTLTLTLGSGAEWARGRFPACGSEMAQAEARTIFARIPIIEQRAERATGLRDASEIGATEGSERICRGVVTTASGREYPMRYRLYVQEGRAMVAVDLTSEDEAAWARGHFPACDSVAAVAEAQGMFTKLPIVQQRSERPAGLRGPAEVSHADGTERVCRGVVTTAAGHEYPMLYRLYVQEGRAMVAVDLTSEDEAAWARGHFPACDSVAATAGAQVMFMQLPGHQRPEDRPTALRDMAEVGYTEGIERSCRGIVAATSGRSYPIHYRLYRQDGQAMVEINLLP